MPDIEQTLQAIDEATAYCVGCGARLSPDGPSDLFCGSGCQRRSLEAQTNAPMEVYRRPDAAQVYVGADDRAVELTDTPSDRLPGRANIRVEVRRGESWERMPGVTNVEINGRPLPDWQQRFVDIYLAGGFTSSEAQRRISTAARRAAQRIVDEARQIQLPTGFTPAEPLIDDECDGTDREPDPYEYPADRVRPFLGPAVERAYRQSLAAEMEQARRLVSEHDAAMDEVNRQLATTPEEAERLGDTAGQIGSDSIPARLSAGGYLADPYGDHSDRETDREEQLTQLRAVCRSDEEFRNAVEVGQRDDLTIEQMWRRICATGNPEIPAYDVTDVEALAAANLAGQCADECGQLPHMHIDDGVVVSQDQDGRPCMPPDEAVMHFSRPRGPWWRRILRRSGEQ